jgi:hypothetical protein
MQKVEGSNPFSRFRKGLHLQAFFVAAVTKCVCVLPLKPDSRPPDRPWLTKNGPYAGLFWSVRTEVLLRALQKVECSA